MLKRFIDKYFDYFIVGEYLDSDGKGHYTTRYIKKYYPRCLKKQYIAYLKRQYYRKRGSHS